MMALLATRQTPVSLPQVLRLLFERSGSRLETPSQVVSWIKSTGLSLSTRRLLREIAQGFYLMRQEPETIRSMRCHAERYAPCKFLRANADCGMKSPLIVYRLLVFECAACTGTESYGSLVGSSVLVSARLGYASPLSVPTLLWTDSSSDTALEVISSQKSKRHITSKPLHSQLL